MPRIPHLGAALLVTAFALPSFAADGVVELPGTSGDKGEMRQPAPATKNRSEVQSEVPAARQGEAGTKWNTEMGYTPDISSAPATRTRQDVMQDLERARRDGTLEQMKKDHEG